MASLGSRVALAPGIRSGLGLGLESLGVGLSILLELILTIISIKAGTFIASLYYY